KELSGRERKLFAQTRCKLHSFFGIHHPLRGLRSRKDDAAGVHRRLANARRRRDCDWRDCPVWLPVPPQSATEPPLSRIPSANAGALSPHDGRAECAVWTSRFG